jgi:general secretion pathway protein G
MGMAQYRQSVMHAREAVLKTDLFDLRDAIDQYYADKGQYPATLEALVSDGYIRRVPIDPITNAADTWQTVTSDPDPNNPTAQIGIKDVRSGSDQIALDGTPYADW